MAGPGSFFFKDSICPIFLLVGLRKCHGASLYQGVPIVEEDNLLLLMANAVTFILWDGGSLGDGKGTLAHLSFWWNYGFCH